MVREWWGQPDQEVPEPIPENAIAENALAFSLSPQMYR